MSYRNFSELILYQFNYYSQPRLLFLKQSTFVIINGVGFYGVFSELGLLPYYISRQLEVLPGKMVSFCLDKIVQFEVVWTEVIINGALQCGEYKWTDTVVIFFGSVINGIVSIFKINPRTILGKSNTTYRKPC
jgi:hypothetical protein